MAAAIATTVSSGKTQARIGVDTVTVTGTGFTANTTYLLELAGPDADRVVFVASNLVGTFVYTYVPQVLGATTINAYPVRSAGLSELGSVVQGTTNYVIDAVALALPSVTATASGPTSSP